MTFSTISKRALFFASVLCITGFAFITPCSAQTTVYYGTTNYGGAYGLGAIVKFNPGTGTEQLAYSFGTATNDGYFPQRDIVYDGSTGLFYGMATHGGTNSAGVIYSFNPATNQESVLWNLGSGTDGSTPVGDLVYNPDAGIYYGLTLDGGTNGGGALISYDPVHNTESVVWSFGGAGDGSSPWGSLVYNTGYKLLFGMTAGGGTNSEGTVFSFNTTGNVETVLYSFGLTNDGTQPFASFIYNASNSLYYATTRYGGTNDDGTIITFNPSNDIEAVVYNFGNAKDGQTPVGNLVYDASNSMYYGLTSTGGTNSDGTIFSFNPSTNAENVSYAFGSVNNDGISPFSDLVYDAGTQLFYGMTYEGGTMDSGAIFSFNAGTNAENVVYSMKGAPSDGKSSTGNLVAYTIPSGINTVNGSTSSVSIYPSPNNGTFSVQVQNVKTNSELEIFNVLGEKVYTGIIISATTEVSLTNASSGVYLYHVLDEQGNQISNGKFVIE